MTGPAPDMTADYDSQQTPLEDIAGPEVVDPSLPEGKSVNDIYNEVQQLRNTNKVNEELIRRMAAEPPRPQVVHVQSQPSAPIAPVQQGPTEEELVQMITDDDPKVRLQAWNMMQQRNNAMLGAALDRRLEPLAQGTIGAAEAHARQKYPVEFEIFADEINQYRQRVPASAFTNPMAWDELMKQVRGSDPQKYVAELQKRNGITTTFESAQAASAANAGFVPPVRSAGSPTGPGGPSSLTDLQRKIAEEFNMTPQEYLHFDRQGNQI